MITLSSDTDDIGQEGAVTLQPFTLSKALSLRWCLSWGLKKAFFQFLEPSIRPARWKRAAAYVCCHHKSGRKTFSFTLLKKISIQLQPIPNAKQILLGTWAVWTNKAAGAKNVYRKEKVQQKLSQIFDRSQIFKEQQKPRKDVSVYRVGQLVSHPRFGEGQIVYISDDGLVGDIVFEDFGKKSLMLELAPLEIL